MAPPCKQKGFPQRFQHIHTKCSIFLSLLQRLLKIFADTLYTSHVNKTQYTFLSLAKNLG